MTRGRNHSNKSADRAGVVHQRIKVVRRASALRAISVASFVLRSREYSYAEGNSPLSYAMMDGPRNGE